MFDNSEFPKSLEESTFEEWLENGRNQNMGYNYLLITWDDYDAVYKPVYLENREEIERYDKYGTASGRESLVAAYDLYSESKLFWDNYNE